MINLVIETPLSADIDMILEVIIAVMRYRGYEGWDSWDVGLLPHYKVDFSKRFKRAYLIEADFADVEMMKAVADLKKILPIEEVYFENHGNTGAAYLESDDFEEGYIEDDALRRLVYEEKHDRREKLSA